LRRERWHSTGNKKTHESPPDNVFFEEGECPEKNKIGGGERELLKRGEGGWQDWTVWVSRKKVGEVEVGREEGGAGIRGSQAAFKASREENMRGDL